ncbi:MAG: glycosyltransferase family 4 protein, partial [candidate division WOR-3 bacterium]
EAKHVYLLPFRKDAIELMADFDVLLLTSEAEGMPLVVLEAQSLGIPVVSTDVGCVGEMTGNVLVARTIEELVRKILAAFNDSIKETCADGSRNFENFVRGYVRIYSISYHKFKNNRYL